MEQQLQQALDATSRTSSHTSPEDPVASNVADTRPQNDNSSESLDFMECTSSSESPSECVQESERLKLPPLQEIVPVVDEFFSNYNTIMPLFDQPTFMRMLSNWYVPSSPQSTAVWAAVNIAMALGYRCALKQPGNLDALVDDQKVQHHMRNVQSVVSELVTREEDLLGLQVLLGMVVLFLGTREPKPASVLIGTAVRLAHRMHLHDKESLQSFSPDIARQRTRLFWMTYTLDKDISLKSTTPSFQMDIDIDLPLPEHNPDDGAGIMCATNGSKFNYFRARVELSHISGKVYDQLYSTRSRKISPQDRQMRVMRLENMLENWRLSLPPEFQMDSALRCLDPLPVVHMSLLYHTHFMAVTMTHGVYSDNADWVKKVSLYSRSLMQDLDAAPSPCGKQNPPLPQGWAKCVELSRSCMRLFADSPKTDCSIWSNSCAHLSGLIIILANMFVWPDHQLVAADNELANQALQLFEQMLSVHKQETLHRMHAVVKELHRRAMEAVEEANALRREKQAAATVTEVRDTDLPFGTQVEEDVDFLQGMEATDIEGALTSNLTPGSMFSATWNLSNLEGLQADVGEAGMPTGLRYY
ncbi:nadh oxidase [Colletotrichum karsti]|uniref:Nadh oxidase n=1 Tax=Colletotrichum karsti TaxID=1095194 RepID=A0A9P6IGL8_9PEZI|nr:nadh oxidase [Colletotrichum karsti]KAF9882500.1 nadh oxidase [Colletotrichum karsti]